MLKVYITLWNVNVSTFGIFLLFALTLTSYVIWREAKKEGFDEEQIFDMEVALILASVFVGRVVYALLTFNKLKEIILHVLKFWTFGINAFGMVSGALVVGFLWVRNKKWSIYRIMDIFIMGISLGVSIILLPFVVIDGKFEFLIAFGLLLFVHVMLRVLRTKGFVFGGLFGIGIMSFTLVLSLFFLEMKSLIFFSFLFTLGSVVLIGRLRSKKVKLTTPISKDFLKGIKDLLSRKDKELAQEELLLKKEDTYAISDRDIMNNEEADEAFEDSEHEKVDILTKSIMEMRLQVRKALAKINIGTYGICDICHKPIDKARLKVFPQATTCIECSEKQK